MSMYCTIRYHWYDTYYCIIWFMSTYDKPLKYKTFYTSYEIDNYVGVCKLKCWKERDSRSTIIYMENHLILWWKTMVEQLLNPLVLRMILFFIFIFLWEKCWEWFYKAKWDCFVAIITYIIGLFWIYIIFVSIAVSYM